MNDHRRLQRHEYIFLVFFLVGHINNNLTTPLAVVSFGATLSSYSGVYLFNVATKASRTRHLPRYARGKVVIAKLGYSSRVPDRLKEQASAWAKVTGCGQPNYYGETFGFAMRCANPDEETAVREQLGYSLPKVVLQDLALAGNPSIEDFGPFTTTEFVVLQRQFFEHLQSASQAGKLNCYQETPCTSKIFDKVAALGATCERKYLGRCVSQNLQPV